MLALVRCALVEVCTVQVFLLAICKYCIICPHLVHGTYITMCDRKIWCCYYHFVFLKLTPVNTGVMSFIVHITCLEELFYYRVT